MAYCDKSGPYELFAEIHFLFRDRERHRKGDRPTPIPVMKLALRSLEEFSVKIHFAGIDNSVRYVLFQARKRLGSLSTRRQLDELGP